MSDMKYSWWSIYCRVAIVYLKVSWPEAFQRKPEHHIAIFPAAIRNDEWLFVIISAYVGSQSKDLLAFIFFAHIVPFLYGPYTIFVLFPHFGHW